ncbi:DUF3040 domain-containing protein [Streptomyces sp. HC307]|uniref:DUF3040 domain-containing protein n=1 Tax=Streptomyces flavusporus TaxID=3385496 RepID=UPI0039174474
MNPSMDDRRILAEMERHLSRDDPELVSLMDALNYQFPEEQQDADSRNDGGGRHDWRWKACIAFALVLVVGLILTLVLSGPPSAVDNHGPPNSRVPAVSVHTQRRGPCPGARHRATPAQQGRRTTELPRGEPHACT